MREIPLHGKHAAGRVALVDDEDYELVSQYRWRIWERQHPGGRVNGPYARATIRQGDRETVISMHKLITGWPQTDHEDRNGLNNQRSNLRPATGSQNCANRRPPLGHASRFKGVAWNRATRKWQVSIGVKGKQRYLGLFVSEEEAARAYDAAARIVHGVFAYLNFPESEPVASGDRGLG